MQTAIMEIIDPIDRFVSFIHEREAVRLRRKNGSPWPWTDDPILQTYRFTNIHREDDAVSLHYQKTIRSRYGEDAMVLPATVLYRWFNRPSTCDFLFNEPDLGNISRFEEYILKGDEDTLQCSLEMIPPPHVTGAFIINGAPGYSKGEGVLQYFFNWCQKPWQDHWKLWREFPPSLEEMYHWIHKDATGLGSFMTAQIIADLKYLPFIRNVRDWWTWAAPGPGSMRGLNVVRGYGMFESWNHSEWLEELCVLNEQVTPMLKERGIDRLHNQDLQNCLCEYSKYTKTATGKGRPRQVFRHQNLKRNGT